jgi:DNA adenine methylase
MYKTIKPFIKWAGGKSQLLPEIRKKYPQTIKSYCEPFVGGGAVLLDVLANFQPEEVLINDINAELVNTYRQVRDNADCLISQLATLQDIFWAADIDKRKEIYLEKRTRFNNIKIDNDAQTVTEKAVLFIFLNKSCFNGLYRVNRKGLFNVPIGSYKKPPICDEDNIRLISDLLSGVEIKCGNYSDCAYFIKENTFVYIDPPYRPLTETASFTSYSENEFGDNEQIELREFIDKLVAKGAKVVASNSDPKNVDETDNFFDDLYNRYIIERVLAKRMINSKSNGRGSINELLICNF